MENTFYYIQHFLGIKAATLFAGIFGALIIFVRKSTGSIQARVSGFLTALVSVIYFVPFLIHVLNLKLGLDMSSAIENLLALVCGLFLQSVTENFIDDPLGSLEKGMFLFKRFKSIFFSNESVPKILDNKESKE